MYLPKQHEETRLDVLHQLIRSHPLGTWVVLGNGELIANHVPFLIDPSRGEFGTLAGHVARANPGWSATPSAVPGVVSFQGPQAYISPSWYPSKHEHGKAVPTWNYAVVHAHGQPSFIEDRDWLYQHITQLTNEHESAQALPWKVEDAPAEFTEQLLGAIVGFEIVIRRLEGKWKTNQNRPNRDKLGVVAGLLGKNDAESKSMASLVRQHIAPK
jgi:transcriptional regulator